MTDQNSCPGSLKEWMNDQEIDDVSCFFCGDEEATEYYADGELICCCGFCFQDNKWRFDYPTIQP